ncbi:MAG: glycine cleavage system aminomethyltransferase GcvT [Candidatus Margulisiibacteriota bacterium]
MTTKTILHNEHLALKAKMTPFAGFDMPVWYSSIQEEHRAVRQSAGLFDISHMGVLRLTGPNTQAFLQTLICNDVAKALAHKMVYGMMLNADGMILDDIMVGYCDDGSFYLVVNASNKAKILAWMAQHNTDGVQIEDQGPTHGFMALQGPKALAMATELFPEIQDMPRFGLKRLSPTVLVMRTGYTGEDGVEILVANAACPQVWKALLSKGAIPCGLGARDSLRIEAGLPLYGHELSESIHPHMTRYGWVVKGSGFIGQAALERLQATNDWTTVGLELPERQIPRQGYAIQEGGEVTSGTLSPLLNKPIGMALVPKKVSDVGSVVHVIIRNTPIPAKIVPIPFK